MKSPDISEIKALMQARALELAQLMAPGGRVVGGIYTGAKNPTRADRHPGSFVIWINKAPGAWKDYATDDKGDILDLVIYCQGLKDRAAGLAWCKQWLGLATMDPKRIAKATADARTRDAALDKERAAEAAEARRRSFGLWLNCRVGLEGTEAQTYLAGRGIDLAALKRPAGALRFHRALHHAPSRTYWPAIVAAVTGANENHIAVHRTYLARDGSGKASVSPPRMVWPGYQGGAIRLARGQTNRTPKAAREAARRDTLALTEGIEDGLALAMACPELRVWAVIAVGNLAHIKVPECAERVIVCADNDWAKPGAQKQLERGLDALTDQGRPVSVARSTVGKDVNDLLRGDDEL